MGHRLANRLAQVTMVLIGALIAVAGLGWIDPRWPFTIGAALFCVFLVLDMDTQNARDDGQDVTVFAPSATGKGT